MKKETIQVARAIAIIFVVLQHILSRVNKSLYEMEFMFILNNIGVVIFMIISGYLFEVNKARYFLDIKKTVTKKFANLYIPYFFWSLLLATGIKIVSLFEVGNKLLCQFGFETWNWFEIFFNTITYSGFYVQHLWYIYALFIIIIINLIIKDTSVNIHFIIGWIALISILSRCFEFPFIIDKVLYQFGIFTIGRLVYKNKLWKLIESKYVVFSSILAMVLIETIHVCLNFIFRDTYLGYVLFGVSATIFVIYISNVLADSKIGKKLSYIGDYSYEIYLVHNPYFTFSIPVLLLYMGIGKSVTVIISLIVSIMCPIIIKSLFDKLKISKIAFGR